jgi:hypothetical protein
VGLVLPQRFPLGIERHRLIEQLNQVREPAIGLGGGRRHDHEEPLRQLAREPRREHRGARARQSAQAERRAAGRNPGKSFPRRRRFAEGFEDGIE